MKPSSLCKVLLLALLIIQSSHITGQTDNQFWFVAPETTREHDKKPGVLQVTTFEHDAHVTISMPANPAFQPIELFIAANSQERHEFWDRVIENPDGTIAYEQMLWTIENGTMDAVEGYEDSFSNDWDGWTPGTPFNKGLLIKSDNPVSVCYTLASRMNPETFNLKGKNALGYEFVIPSQDLYENHPSAPNAREKADIVATEDNTSITIELTNNHGIAGHRAGSVFTITLDKGQTYSLRSTSPHQAHHLGGTYISSDKPVAITISDDSIALPEGTGYGEMVWDLAGDQLLPIRSLGTEYIAMNTAYNYDPAQDDGSNYYSRYPFSSGQQVFIMAATEKENGTMVFVNGRLLTSLGRGEFSMLDIADNAMHIKADAPIYVYQFISFRYELGNTVLQPISSTWNTKVISNKFLDGEFLIQFLAQGKYIHDFIMFSDYEEIPLDDLTWTAVNGTENSSDDETWYSAVKGFPNNTIAIDETYTIVNAQNASFHLSSIESTSTGAIFSNYPSPNILKIIGPTKACQGNEITLYSNQINKELRWYHESNPNEPFSNSDTVTVTESGEYWVETSNASYNPRDYLYIEFSSVAPTIELWDVLENQGESHTYIADDGYSSYFWENTTTNEEIIPENPAEPHIVELFEPATIRLTVTNEYSCSATDAFTFSWDVISGLNEAVNNEKLADLLVYPTPVTGDVIYFNKNISGTLYQTDGELVFEFNNTDQLNISTLKPGVYIIQGENGQTARLVKK